MTDRAAGPSAGPHSSSAATVAASLNSTTTAASAIGSTTDSPVYATPIRAHATLSQRLAQASAARQSAQQQQPSNDFAAMFSAPRPIGSTSAASRGFITPAATQLSAQQRQRQNDVEMLNSAFRPASQQLQSAVRDLQHQLGMQQQTSNPTAASQQPQAMVASASASAAASSSPLEQVAQLQALQRQLQALRRDTAAASAQQQQSNASNLATAAATSAAATPIVSTLHSHMISTHHQTNSGANSSTTALNTSASFASLDRRPVVTPSASRLIRTATVTSSQQSLATGRPNRSAANAASALKTTSKSNSSASAAANSAAPQSLNPRHVAQVAKQALQFMDAALNKHNSITAAQNSRFNAILQQQQQSPQHSTVLLRQLQHESQHEQRVANARIKQQCARLAARDYESYDEMSRLMRVESVLHHSMSIR